MSVSLLRLEGKPDIALISSSTAIASLVFSQANASAIWTARFSCEDAAPLDSMVSKFDRALASSDASPAWWPVRFSSSIESPSKDSTGDPKLNLRHTCASGISSAGFSSFDGSVEREEAEAREDDEVDPKLNTGSSNKSPTWLSLSHASASAISSTRFSSSDGRGREFCSLEREEAEDDGVGGREEEVVEVGAEEGDADDLDNDRERLLSPPPMASNCWDAFPLRYDLAVPTVSSAVHAMPARSHPIEIGR